MCEVTGMFSLLGRYCSWQSGVVVLVLDPDTFGFSFGGRGDRRKVDGSPCPHSASGLVKDKYLLPTFQIWA